MELMVVFGVMALFALLSFGLAGKLRHAADRTAGVHTLRSIGYAILAYTHDHSSRLPGPLWPGQIPTYEPSRPGRLVVFLKDYLPQKNYDVGAVVEAFVPPAVRREFDANSLPNSRPYVMNHAFAGTDGTRYSPWGNLATGLGSPQSLATISSATWAMSDADQSHPRVRGTSWASNTPRHPVHGKRLALFLNGSVLPVHDATLE